VILLLEIQYYGSAKSVHLLSVIRAIIATIFVTFCIDKMKSVSAESFELFICYILDDSICLDPYTVTFNLINSIFTI
jgi:hypothetical protein